MAFETPYWLRGFVVWVLASSVAIAGLSILAYHDFFMFGLHRRATLRGHASTVQCLAFSPDGQTVASAGFDRTIRLWHTGTGRELRILRGHTDYIDTVEFSPDGRTLSSGAHDGMVKLWDVNTGQELATLHRSGEHVESVAFSPNGQLLAWSAYDGVRLWDLASKKELRALPPQGQHSSSELTFTPDGKHLAITGNPPMIWNIGTGKLTRFHQFPASNFIRFSPDGSIVATRGETRGKDWNWIYLWDAATGQQRAVLKGHTTPAVYDAIFSPDGKTLASASCLNEEVSEVLLWDVESASLRTVVLRRYDSLCTTVVFSPDGKTLGTIARHDAAELWDMPENPD